MRQRPLVTGSVLAVMVALKVVPIVLLWWLITQRAWRAVAAFGVASAVLVVVVILGAGPQSLIDYLAVVGHTAAEGSNALSLAGLARSAGLDASFSALIPPLVVLAAAGLMLRLRARPDVSFAIGVVAMVFGSPVVVVYWYAMLLAATAPYPAPSPPRIRPARVSWPRASRASPPSLPNRGPSRQRPRNLGARPAIRRRGLTGAPATAAASSAQCAGWSGSLACCVAVSWARVRLT